MGFLFKTERPQIQPLPEPPISFPDEDDENVRAAQAFERERIRRMKGRASTILTQGLNLGQPTLKKTILGGGNA